jgi:hypothetical protein
MNFQDNCSVVCSPSSSSSSISASVAFECRREVLSFLGGWGWGGDEE